MLSALFSLSLNILVGFDILKYPLFVFIYHSNAYKKLIGSFETQIKNGRSPMEMPTYPIASLSRSVIGCNTGPYGGLCQLDPELDHPTHDRGQLSFFTASTESQQRLHAWRWPTQENVFFSLIGDNGLYKWPDLCILWCLFTMCPSSRTFL